MGNFNPHNFFTQRPVDVEWAGWRSDTFSLQRAGWQLSARQDLHLRELSVALHHPEMGISGMSALRNFQFMDPRAIYGMVLPFRLGGDYRIIEHRQEPMHEYYPIDATPMFRQSQPQRLEDFKIFRELPKEASKEIYLEEASLSEVLDIALSKQESRQAEIRARMLRDEKLKQMSDVKASLRLIA